MILTQSIMRSGQFERLCLEEYRALRAESLRCAGIISNTIWIGITQFAATLIAVLVLGGDCRAVPLILITLLSLESLASTAMFLSELFKFSRIGRYIREKVEKAFLTPLDSKGAMLEAPISWEHWIKDKRSRLFYIISLFALQLPIAVSFFTLIFAKSIVKIDAIVWSEHSLLGAALLVLLCLVIVIDVCFVVVMGFRINKEGKRDFYAK